MQEEQRSHYTWACPEFSVLCLPAISYREEVNIVVREELGKVRNMQ